MATKKELLESSITVSAALAAAGHDAIREALKSAGGKGVAEAEEVSLALLAVAEGVEGKPLSARQAFLVAEAVDAAGGPQAVANTLAASRHQPAVAEALEAAGGKAAIAKALSAVTKTASRSKH